MPKRLSLFNESRMMYYVWKEFCAGREKLQQNIFNYRQHTGLQSLAFGVLVFLKHAFQIGISIERVFNLVVAVVKSQDIQFIRSITLTYS